MIVMTRSPSCVLLIPEHACVRDCTTYNRLDSLCVVCGDLYVCEHVLFSYIYRALSVLSSCSVEYACVRSFARSLARSSLWSVYESAQWQV